MSLTPKQEAFCLRYLETGNASEAYRRAYDAEGMKPASVNRKAFELLANVKITAFLNELKARQLKRHDVTVERVLREYAKLAFLDIRKAFDEDGKPKMIQEIDDDTAAAIAGIEAEDIYGGRGEDREIVARLHKIKLSDKKGALDSLAKHLGMFTDKLELTGKDGGPIVTKEQRDAAVAAALGADS